VNALQVRIKENEIGSFLLQTANNQLLARSVIVYDYDLYENGSFQIGFGESSNTQNVLNDNIDAFLLINSVKTIKGSSSLNILNYRAFDFEQLNVLATRDLKSGKLQKVVKFNVSYKR